MATTSRDYGAIVPLLFDLLGDAPRAGSTPSALSSTTGPQMAPQMAPSPQEGDYGGASPFDDSEPGTSPTPTSGPPPGTQPVDTNADSGVPYYLQDPNQFPNASIYVDPDTGILYDAQGGSLPKWQSDQIYAQYGAGAGGGGGAPDPYAGESNARANQAQAEAIRARRIAEAQQAAQMYQSRIMDAQAARLAGAKFSLTPQMKESGYFPAFAPNDPLVQSGLSPAIGFTPIGFDPERGVNMDEQQIAADLAKIRGMA